MRARRRRKRPRTGRGRHNWNCGRWASATPPSESIAQTALPLAATAAAATAAAYCLAQWASHEQALAENLRAERVGGSADYDTAGAGATALTLGSGGDEARGGGRVEEQLPPQPDTGGARTWHPTSRSALTRCGWTVRVPLSICSTGDDQHEGGGGGGEGTRQRTGRFG